MIIYAINNHSGGGRVILDKALLGEELVDEFGAVTHAFVDERYTLPQEVSGCEIIRIKPKLISRLLAEWKLRKLSFEYPQSPVVCFTNMPPIFRLSAKTTLFFQNALLLPGMLKFCKNWKHKLRTTYEHLILRFFYQNVDQVFVQTMWVRDSLAKMISKPILIRPILPEKPSEELLKPVVKTIDFLAISGQVDYKNLFFLLKNWEKLPELKQKKTVIVVDTIDDRQKIMINNLLHSGYSIEIQKKLSRAEVYELYRHSKCLLISSSIESYCLPLYEAQYFNLPIIAPDLPYAREAARNDIQYYKNLDDLSFQNSIKNCL